MKCIFPVIFLASVYLVSNSAAGAVIGKKGIGLAEKKGLGEKQLQALKVHWYYNWSSKTTLSSPVQFVPMIFSKRGLDSVVQEDVVLGFNEPDNSKQANMSVQDALNAWPKVASKAKRVGGPAMAGSPMTGDWLPQFMKASPKVDFVTVHWYKGANSKKFKKDLEAIHDHYKLPVWVTEFAPQTAGSARDNPAKFSQAEVDTFIKETLSWMEKTPFIERYAWHDSKVGTSALFDDKGELTKSGLTYAAAKE